jgi:CRP/FNR family transcriptional regulator, cyclic AMP receptor protein
VVDPDLASAIKSSARRKAAARAVTAEPLELAPGQQLDDDLISSEETLGIALLGGFLIREWTTAGHVSADLLGPDDVVHPWGGEPMITMLRHSVTWTAITPARLAVLDDGFFERAAPWPEISGSLLQRSGRLAQRLALRGAIETLTVDARLLASLWLWASQWATVAGQGVVLRVPLSHERIARLIHARRPTVTSAIGRLKDAGLVNQRQGGAWVLRGPSSDNGAQGEVTMPQLGEMVERGFAARPKRGPVSATSARAATMRELRERLAEQRATLEAAATRHREMLERLRRETGRLTGGSDSNR